jgi:L-amino acid N-acyltransferase YncA
MTTTTRPTIVPCTEAHIPEITRIYGDSVLHGTSSFETEAPSVEEMLKRRANLVNAGYPYLVALIDNQVAGYAYSGPYRPRLAYATTTENSVYVNPAFQRRGVAKALLDALVRECSNGRWRLMIAVIGDSSNIASRKLHETAGFTLVGTFISVGYKHGRWLDTVLMQRALGEGNTTPPLR